MSINDGGGGKINGGMQYVASYVVDMKYNNKKKSKKLCAVKAAASSNQRANIAMGPGKIACIKCMKSGNTTSSC